jgi:DNA-binding GntR family transcriptional regulator
MISGAGHDGGAAGTVARTGWSEQLTGELVDAVRLARLAPGARLAKSAFAALGRATEEQLLVVMPAIVATGLVTVEGDDIVVRPLDKDAIFATLPRRRELEIAIARAAAAKASEDQLKAMQASELVQRRCAMIGDMDGLILAERDLERLLVAASGLVDEGAELMAIKQEFRRAWCSANRLRDFTNVANIRAALVAAVAARDADAAEAQIHVFFTHILQTY